MQILLVVNIFRGANLLLLQKKMKNMKTFVNMLILTGSVAAAVACTQKEEAFQYTLDTFADIKVMRYRVPGWEALSLDQKAYAYHLAEAAKWGRDIYWDQNCKYNLPLRHARSRS